MPEYGRNVQRLIFHAKTIENDGYRQRFVEQIIRLMFQMQPRTKNQEPDKYISTAGVSKEAWEGFQALRRARKAPVTVSVVKSLEKQAGLANMTLDDAMRLCAERGWLTMRADWVAGKQQALEDRNRKIAQEWANG